MTHPRPRPARRSPWPLAAAALGLAACAEEEVAPVPRAGAYTVVPGWPEVAEGELLGQVSGVGVDAGGDVLVFRRADRDWNGGAISPEPIAAPTILRFDPDTGEERARLGAGQFAMPHGLTVDARGHLWVTDVGLHVVVELAPDGSVVRTLGEPGVSGEDALHFNRPTDVAVTEDGTVFVSDGYGNGRVVVFAADGQVLRTFGSIGTGPGQLLVPHGIALGPDGNVYVADRGNARVQIFTQAGELVSEWKSEALGRPWAIAFAPTGEPFVVDGGDQPVIGPDRARVLITDAAGAVLESFGTFGNRDGELNRPHDIAVGLDGAVYVVEVGSGRRAQKFDRP